MTQAEQNALANIAASTDPLSLMQIARNSHRASPTVARAAIRRLADISSNRTRGTVEHDCWQMVHTIEALRKLNGHRVWRMHRMRPKIDRDGEIGALAYCALNETDGFAEVMGYGLPELTAEAIVLRHASHFRPEVIASARARLEQRGVQIDPYGNIV